MNLTKLSSFIKNPYTTITNKININTRLNLIRATNLKPIYTKAQQLPTKSQLIAKEFKLTQKFKQQILNYDIQNNQNNLTIQQEIFNNFNNLKLTMGLSAEISQFINTENIEEVILFIKTTKAMADNTSAYNLFDIQKNITILNKNYTISPNLQQLLLLINPYLSFNKTTTFLISQLNNITEHNQFTLAFDELINIAMPNKSVEQLSKDLLNNFSTQQGNENDNTTLMHIVKNIINYVPNLSENDNINLYFSSHSSPNILIEKLHTILNSFFFNQKQNNLLFTLLSIDLQNRNEEGNNLTNLHTQEGNLTIDEQINNSKEYIRIFSELANTFFSSEDEIKAMLGQIGELILANNNNLNESIPKDWIFQALIVENLIYPRIEAGMIKAGYVDIDRNLYPQLSLFMQALRFNLPINNIYPQLN